MISGETSTEQVIEVSARARVAVAGDEVSVCRALSALGEDVIVVACAYQAAHLANAGADAAVVSCALSPLEAPLVLEQLHRIRPGLPIVAISLSAGAHAVRRALRAGASGCVHETDVERALLPALRAVLAGQRCVPGSCAASLDPPAFSARERQALALVAEGLPNSELARIMFLAESTVKTHLVTAFRKLGVRSRAEAGAVLRDPERAREHGL